MSLNELILNINILKEKKYIQNLIKNIIFQNNGIIFGDIVINNIISEKFLYYYLIDNNINEIDDNYWNKDYQINTIKRLLISDEIDIFFKNINIHNNFILMIRKIGFNIKNMNNYNINNNINIIKYSIDITIGKTIIYEGYNIEIKLNIYIIITNTKYIEPPFNNLISTNDIFIEDKNNIRYSNYTGTFIDKYNNYKKLILINNLISKLLNKEVYMITNHINETKKDEVIDYYNKLNKKYYIINFINNTDIMKLTFL